jgi:hypothetical protein
MGRRGAATRRSAHAFAFRFWIAAWPGAAVVGVADGIVREATYGKRLPEAAAHQVSTATAITTFVLYFPFLDERWPIENEDRAWTIGATWLALTVGFEFVFGRLVAKASWDELLADYNLARGRTWPLVLAWIGLGPWVTRKLRAR